MDPEGAIRERTANRKLPDVNLDDDAVRWFVEELVRAGMRSPLRDPILAAVEETTDEGETASARTSSADETGGKSRISKAVRGIAVFAVTLLVLYGSLRWLTGEDEV